jgi:polyhydroxyalkanoate synthesis regulator phasin
VQYRPSNQLSASLIGSGGRRFRVGLYRGKLPWYFAFHSLTQYNGLYHARQGIVSAEIPHEILKGVKMTNLLEKGFLAGIGLLSMTREKAQDLIDELSQEGELQKSEAKQWVDQLSDRGEEERQALRKLIRDEMKKVLDEMGLVTKEDIKELLKKQD